MNSDETECIEWVGATQSKGYGALSYKGRYMLAHRRAWEASFGPIDKGLHVLHACDNRRCINPKHLWLGTNDDNMADRDEKGRVAKGTKHYLAKLNPDAVRDIRLSIENGSLSVAKLAEKYDVSTRTIQQILSGRSWKDVK